MALYWTRRWGETMKDGLKKISSLVFRLFAIAVVGLVMMTAYQKFTNKGEPTSFFGYQPLTVLSNSMNPIFKTGDMLFVKKVDAANVQVDDIITFRESGGNLITHRVVEVRNNSGFISFATKGDNNNKVDEELVEAESLLGKHTFFVPGMGYLVNAIQSPLGLLLIVILPTLGYFAVGIFSRKQDEVDEVTMEGN